MLTSDSCAVKLSAPNIDEVVIFVLAVVYIVALLAGLGLAGLSIATLIRPTIQFWPPPSARSWQHATFRGLFRVFFLGLLVLSLIDFGDRGSALWRFGLGVPLVLVGFGLALLWTNILGWRNAFGEARGLKTDGAYRWSRNPIYVVSIVGMVGWGITAWSWRVDSLLVLWAAFYILAPFLEEPWLEKHYGEAFTSYRARVPRFVGFRGSVVGTL